MIVDIATEKRIPVNEIKDMKLKVLGEAICEKELTNETRDKLVQGFIDIARKELQEYNDIESYRYVVLTNPGGEKHIPKLLIHTSVKDTKEFKSILKVLRDYFQIQGGLRLPTMGCHYKTDTGEHGYFDDKENELTLILDFTEYKCNNTYKKLQQEMVK